MNQLDIATRSRVVACLVEGNSSKPDYALISTSICEHQNLTMRMGMGRFTRFTNAFLKKIENHEHSIVVHYVYYISAGFTRACESRQRWRQESPTTFGASKK